MKTETQNSDRKEANKMLSFVICEDEKVLATEYKNEVDKFMMNYDHEYQIKYLL